MEKLQGKILIVVPVNPNNNDEIGTSRIFDSL
ncbi:unnamed protein product, partial [marine sediment metagenome]